MKSPKEVVLPVFGIPVPMRGEEVLRVCETCPFLKKNHGKRHTGKWYTVGNLRRLWNGLRTGKAPGMICHSTDPASKHYGGAGNVKPGKEQECAGALILLFSNLNAAAGLPQPHQPPLTKAVIAHYAWGHLLGGLPKVEDRSSDVGLPPLQRKGPHARY